MPEYNVSNEVLAERIGNLKEDLAGKHSQNRNDIHGLRNSVQDLGNEIWLLKVKIAGYSAAAGVITAVCIKMIDHFWKT